MSLDKFPNTKPVDKAKMTPGQRALIWRELNALGIGADRELVRDMARGVCGGRTISKFSKTDAGRFIRHLKSLQGKDPDEGLNQRRKKPAPVRSTGGSGTDTISEAQLYKINQLYDTLGAEPHHRRELNERQCGKPWPQSKKDATAVILALSDMQATGQRFGNPRRQK